MSNFTYEEQDSVIVKTDKDGKVWFIPKDESNSDYQQYLNPTEHLQTIVPMEGAN